MITNLTSNLYLRKETAISTTALSIHKLEKNLFVPSCPSPNPKIKRKTKQLKSTPKYLFIHLPSFHYPSGSKSKKCSPFHQRQARYAEDTNTNTDAGAFFQRRFQNATQNAVPQSKLPYPNLNAVDIFKSDHALSIYKLKEIFDSNNRDAGTPVMLGID
jgi:hypothetical protein